MSHDMPWDNGDLRDDVMKNISVRLPETLKAKFDYLIAKSPKSGNEAIVKMIAMFVEKNLDVK